MFDSNESARVNKRMKINASETIDDGGGGETEDEKKRLLCRFKSEGGELLGDLMDLPMDCNTAQLTLICNALLQQVLSQLYTFDSTCSHICLTHQTCHH